MNTADGLASDLRSLDRLKLDASRDPAAAVKQAAGQFEAIFMQSLLKSMRDASPKSGLMGSSSQDMYTGMLDQQFAQKLSGRSGGIGDMIARQLSRNIAGGSTPAVVRQDAAASGQSALGSALRLRAASAPGAMAPAWARRASSEKPCAAAPDIRMTRAWAVAACAMPPAR